MCNNERKKSKIMHTPKGLDTASAAITRQTQRVPTGSNLWDHVCDRWIIRFTAGLTIAVSTDRSQAPVYMHPSSPFLCMPVASNPLRHLFPAPQRSQSPPTLFAFSPPLLDVRCCCLELSSACNAAASATQSKQPVFSHFM